MKNVSRLARVQYVTDPSTGRTWPIPAGGSDDPPADPAAEPSADPAADPSADPDPSDPPSDPDPDWLDDKTKRVVAAIREDFKEERSKRQAAQQEAAAARAEAEQARTELARDIGKALGLVTDDPEESPDPDVLQQAIAERDAKISAKTVELDAFRAAGRFKDPKIAPDGVNPDALLDSRTFLEKAASLDPTSDTYSADLESAIKTAVESNPLLAASPGGGHRGGPAQGPRPTPTQQPASLEDAFAAHYTQ
jgi:hypothetical protein